MDLTTELLDNAAFREAKRGYNTQEVDEFIEQVKVEYGRHDALVRDARQRIEDAEARVAEAERRAAEATERAASSSDTDDTLKRTLVLAQRTADAAIKEAEEQAARTLSSAQDQSARMLADAQEAAARAKAEAESDARRAQEDARARVLAELRELETSRDQVRSDVDALERHLGEQRDRVRFATSELQRLLDDPAALEPTDAPVVSEAAAPAAPPVPAPIPDPVPVAAPVVEPLVPAPPAPADDDPVTWTPDDEAWQEPEAPAATPAPSPAYAEAEADGEGGDDGPNTETIDLLGERDAGDDAYLAELRKAMTDESPLGPREDGDAQPLFDAGPEPSRSRFGRRR
jgi:DivIVA domain-containing protein